MAVRRRVRTFEATMLRYRRDDCAGREAALGVDTAIAA